MLPVSIIANWCLTSATREVFEAALAEYVNNAEKATYQQNTHAVHWRERTVFTLEDSEWSRNEGSLLFENRRGVLWRGAHNQDSHLVFLTLFPSSLGHLKTSIAEIIQSKFDSTVSAVELSLGKGSANFANKDIAGAELTNFNNETLVVVEGRLPNDPELFDHIQDDDIGFFENHRHKFYLSKLYLKLGDLRTEAVLSRDGVITINDPDLSLDEVIGILSEVIGNVPSSIAGSHDQVFGQSGSAASASQSAGASTNMSNLSANTVSNDLG